MSHEIRNPLNGTVGYLRLLARWVAYWANVSYFQYAEYVHVCCLSYTTADHC